MIAQAAETSNNLTVILISALTGLVVAASPIVVAWIRKPKEQRDAERADEAQDLNRNDKLWKRIDELEAKHVASHKQIMSLMDENRDLRTRLNHAEQKLEQLQA